VAPLPADERAEWLRAFAINLEQDADAITEANRHKAPG